MTDTVCKPSVLWFIAKIIGMISSRSYELISYHNSVMNCGKWVYDE